MKDGISIASKPNRRMLQANVLNTHRSFNMSKNADRILTRRPILHTYGSTGLIIRSNMTVAAS
jgi:hypothetical protein